MTKGTLFTSLLKTKVELLDEGPKVNKIVDVNLKSLLFFG